MTCPDTRLVYVTNAMFKEKLIGNHQFVDSYTHIILDEIHDRELDTDFVILLIKLSLRNKYKGKVLDQNFEIFVRLQTLNIKSLLDHINVGHFRSWIAHQLLSQGVVEVTAYSVDCVANNIA